LKSQPEVEETVNRFSDLLNYLLPQYRREGKSYLTVGIGCTGGRHRSVMIANELTSRLRRAGFDATPYIATSASRNLALDESYRFKESTSGAALVGGVIVSHATLGSEFPRGC
jgi:hypothetical protein